MVDLNYKKRYYSKNVECIKTKGTPIPVKDNKVKDLKEAIKLKEKQLAKLKKHVDKSVTCSDLYNKVVLEKAILNKELKDINEDCFISKIKKIMPHKKILICDYFKG